MTISKTTITKKSTVSTGLAKLLILTIAFTLALSVNYLFAAWVGPTASPPGDNTPTPIHVGTTAQVKDGPLSITRLLVSPGAGTNGESYLMGPVGIGTVNPSSDLHIHDTGVSNAYITTDTDLGTNNSTLWFSADRDGTENWAGIGMRNDGSLRLTGSGGIANPHMVITDSGFIGIGTLSPVEKLDVSGGVKVGNTTSANAGTIRWSGSDFEGYDGSAWVSLTSGETTIVSSDATDCTNVGGDWIDADSVCYIAGSSCPNGWIAKENYSSSRSNSCEAKCENCSTGEHIRTNTAVENCKYYTGPNTLRACAIQNRQLLICSATQTEIGCVKIPNP